MSLGLFGSPTVREGGAFDGAVISMAAVAPVWQLEERQKRQEKFFGLVEKAWERNKEVRPEIIEREVEEAVRAVRAQTRRKKG